MYIKILIYNLNNIIFFIGIIEIELRRKMCLTVIFKKANFLQKNWIMNKNKIMNLINDLKHLNLRKLKF